VQKFDSRKQKQKKLYNKGVDKSDYSNFDTLQEMNGLHASLFENDQEADIYLNRNSSHDNQAATRPLPMGRDQSGNFSYQAIPLGHDQHHQLNNVTG